MITAAEALEISETLEQREQQASLQACQDRIVDAANSGNTNVRVEMASASNREYCVTVLLDLGYTASDNGNEILISWESND